MKIIRRLEKKLLDYLDSKKEDGEPMLIHTVNMLHYYTSKCDMDMVSKLLEEGADPNVKDEKSITPLMIAASKHHWGIVKLLIHSGANLYTKNLNGETSFDIIMGYVNKYFDMVKKGVDELVSFGNVIDEHFDIEYIGMYENDFIMMIDLIKEIELLSIEEHETLVNSIYSVCYEYLKLIFIYNKDSNLFDGLKSNSYDREFINSFIKKDIDTLFQSVNYIEGILELREEIKKIKEDDYVSKEVIELLSICYYKEQSKSFNKNLRL